MRKMQMGIKCLTLLGFIIATAACSTIDRFLGVGKSISTKEIYIGTSDCALPCLFDITSGKTDYSQVTDKITSRIPVNQIIDKGERFWNFWIYGTDHNKIFVTIKSVMPSSDTSVARIELSAHGKGRIITLGDMINAGFKPIKVFRNRVQGPNSVNLLIVFSGDAPIIGAVSGSHSINADSPINDLYLFNAKYFDDLLDDIRAIQHYDYQINWLGYTSVDAYLNSPPQ